MHFIIESSPHIRRINSLALLSCIAISAFACPVLADDLFKYQDKQGRVHYVDALSKIPEEYRDDSARNKITAEISKVEAPSNAEPAGIPSDNRAEVYLDKRPKASRNMHSGKVELFVAEWCGYCRALEAEMKRERIPYIRFDIDKSDRGRLLYENLGGGGLPLARINSKTLVHGKNIGKIKEALAGE